MKRKESIERWKWKVLMLHACEAQFKRELQKKSLTKREEREVRKGIKKAWIDIWDEYPEQTFLTKKFLVDNFGEKDD